MADNKVEIKVTADTAQAVAGVVQVEKTLQDVANKQPAVAQAAEQSSARQVASTKKNSESVQELGVKLDSLKTQLLGLVGVGVGVQGVKDIAAVADAYNNLSARIKLTTGEGKAFDTAFEGVFAVAKRTSSAVEETGILFTKLAEAGKTLGVSQAEALKLTETVNQSIQLSGGSAESAKAAIVQLVQGLQSGVLRGDEFNSVMEQSPRLAKALADGLGVTTGALRTQANEGKLTSEVVIKALQNQSDVIGSEFGKLPATVGRAMTNLSTEFTKYVGEADKAGGYTTKLAGLIDGLSSNLSTVASVMLHTGQALGAMKLLSFAQDWLGASVAVKAAAASTEAAAVSTEKSAIATRANSVAITTETQAKYANITATTALNAANRVADAQWASMTANAGGAKTQVMELGKAAQGAAAPVGMLGNLLGTIKAFALLDIALNFKSYGTAIGEAAAKLMGAKDATAELAKQEKFQSEILEASNKMRRDQAAALKEATDRSFGLSKAGTELIGKFDELRIKGDSAGEAIGKIGKDFDLATVPGIQNAVAVLDKLKADGELTATEFQAAWATALKGQDLAEFEVKAKTAFLQIKDNADKLSVDVSKAIARGVEGEELEALKKKAEDAFAATTREAERTSQVLDGSLRESIRRTGLDFEVISGGMGKASRSAINDTEALVQGLDRLKAQGVDTGLALTASITKSIDTADGKKAIEAVRGQIESLRKVLGDKVADGLLDQAKQKADELASAMNKLKPGIQDVKEAMRVLGITSDESLKKTAQTAGEAYEFMRNSISASARELKEGFQKYADAAIAANKGVASEAIKSEAAMRGLEVVTDSAGKTIVRAMGSGTEAAQNLGYAFEQAGQASVTAAERAEKALEQVRLASERVAEAERKRLNVDKDGFSLDKDGKKLVAGGDLTTRTGIKKFLQSAGVTDDAAATRITNEFANSKGEIDYFSNAGQMKYGGANSTMSQALLKAAEQFTFAGKPITAAPGGQASATSGASTSAPTQLVRIDLSNGQKFEVNTASAGDAQQLNGLLRALEDAKRASGL